MNFIERWLEISPDGGDGTLETLLILCTLTLVAGLAYRVSSGFRSTVNILAAKMVRSIGRSRP